MKKFLTGFSKPIAVFAFITLMVGAAFAQVTLRKAIDFDGDNKADFSVFRPSNNTWYIRGSTGSFTAQQFGASNTDYMTPGDYDGDGKGDISVWRDTDGGWYRINSSTNTFFGLTFGTTGDEPVARDYDGDGKTDVAVIRRSGGAMIWYVLKSTDGGLLASQFGAATDYAAPGDYDGDLKFDFAVQRPGANLATDLANFYILKSSDGGLMSVGWGFGTDIVVPGDYDGDGKTDVAVIREGATDNDPLIWYVLRSSDGGLFAVAFGSTLTDINVQNDYDGDGKTDVAVWRETDGGFYILKSTDGLLTGLQFGGGGDFPIASYDTH